MVGFLGVLIVTSPGSETFQIGALFALGNALLFGTVTTAGALSSVDMTIGAPHR